MVRWEYSKSRNFVNTESLTSNNIYPHLDLCQRCRESGRSGWSDPWAHCHHKPGEESLADEVKRLRNVIQSVINQKDFISYAIEKELREALEEKNDKR